MTKTLRTALAILALTAAAALGACAQTRTSESAGGYVDDTAITGKVKTAILQDPALKVMEIHVDTFKGVVQLSGFVDSSQMVERAATVASNVSGVASVQNDLIVK
jgi:osmotically-inducible protein OsmY